MYCAAKIQNQHYSKDSSENRLQTSPTNLDSEAILEVNDYGRNRAPNSMYENYIETFCIV